MKIVAYPIEDCPVLVAETLAILKAIEQLLYWDYLRSLWKVILRRLSGPFQDRVTLRSK